MFEIVLLKFTDVPLMGATLLAALAVFGVWLATFWNWLGAYRGVVLTALVGWGAYEAFFFFATGRVDRGLIEAAMACQIWAVTFHAVGWLLNFAMEKLFGRSL